MNTNYPSASAIVRKIADVTVPHVDLAERDGFRAVRFAPHWSGFQFWVISPKGFLWEMFDDEGTALSYLSKGDFDA